MNCLSISLFGKSCVTAHDGNKLVIESAKALELFFFLLLYADRPHTRDKLAELLWQESSSLQSKKYLRHTLWQLQSVLDENLSTPKILIADSNWIQINPEAQYWLDTQTFERAYKQSHGVNGSELSSTAAQALMDAVTLYRGDLLENWYHDWCLFERERLQNLYLTILHKLMVYCECMQQYETGIAYGMKVLQCDRAREQTHRRLIRLYFLAGDRTSALRQYERCAAILDQELAVDPSQRTLDLIQQVRKGGLTKIGSKIEISNFSEASHLSPRDFLTNLHQLKDVLIQTQKHVDQNISVLQNQRSSPIKTDYLK